MNRERTSPWWLELLVGLAPMAAWIAYDYRDELRDWAGEQGRRLLHAALGIGGNEPSIAHLEALRLRYEAGVYADDGGPALDGHAATDSSL